LSAGSTKQESLPDLESTLFIRALQTTEGKLTIANIAEWGSVSTKQARRLQANWAVQGWLAKDAAKDNSFCLTEKARNLLPDGANRQTRQTGQTGTNPSQTV